MPSKNVTVTAAWSYNSSNGNNNGKSGGSGSSGGNYTPTTGASSSNKNLGKAETLLRIAGRWRFNFSSNEQRNEAQE